VNLISLGQKIQAAREERKLSQEQLANAIGCSQSALSNYEKGKRRIYLSQLEKLSEILEKPLNYFVENFEENNRELLVPNLKDNNILKIINSIYYLTEEEINEVDKFINFLKWKRTQEEVAHGLGIE
jgi:Predicted transcriptional regulator